MDSIETQKKLKPKRKFRKIFLLIPAFLLVAYFLLIPQDNRNNFEFIKVQKKDIKQSIQISGNVAAGASVDLSFRVAGTLKKFNYEVGDSIKTDQVIAMLQNQEQLLNIQRAKANLAASKANLDQKLAGATDQDLKISEVSVFQAEAALTKASVDLENAQANLDLLLKRQVTDKNKAQLALEDASNKLAAAKKNQENIGNSSSQSLDSAKKDLENQINSSLSTLQQSFLAIKSLIGKDGNSVLGQDYRLLDINKLNILIDNYSAAKTIFDNFSLKFKAQIIFSQDDLKTYTKDLESLLQKVIDIDKGIGDVLAITQSSDTLSKAQLSTYKTNFASDATVLSGSIFSLGTRLTSLLNAELNLQSNGDLKNSDVLSAENFYEQQKQALDQLKINQEIEVADKKAGIKSLQAQVQIQQAQIASAKASLDLKKAKPRSIDIAFLKAQVAAANVDVSISNDAYDKTLLKAPFDGIVSLKMKEVGESVNPAEKIVEMISNQKYKIDIEVPEVDINKIKTGDSAQITIDALGINTVLNGTIKKIDPTETVVQDVVFYKAEVVIEDQNDQIKPGMTAEVEIVQKESKGVLTIPEKAVQTDDLGKKYVRIFDGKNEQKISVEVGITNLEGDIEIISGLKEDQEIILRNAKK